MNNENIAKVIWHDALQNSMKPFSWGVDFSNVKVIEKGTSFYLFKTQCWIEVRYLPEMNLYQITVKPDNEESEITYDCVPLDKIVAVIDDTVSYGLASYDFICSKYGLIYKVAV